MSAEGTPVRQESTSAERRENVGATTERTAAARETVSVEHAPSRAAQAVTIAASLVGAGLTAPFTLPSLLFGVSGVLIVVLSALIVYSIGWLSVGAAMILVGALVAGVLGTLSTEVILLGVGATVVAWDAGQHGIVLGEQLGRQTRTRRNLLVHVAATTFAITSISALAYVVSLGAGEGRPASAVSVVVFGILLLAWLFRQ